MTTREPRYDPELKHEMLNFGQDKERNDPLDKWVVEKSKHLPGR